jgi:ParB family transcriptional regulator, chromosome partitioning protein
MKRNPLGRGLGALIPAASIPSQRDGYAEVDTDLIDPNPVQPRSKTNHGDLDGLMASIKESGIVQPILLRRKGTRYQLIAGERRWLASQRAGLLKIPAIVRDVPDDMLLEVALIENIQRQELTPIEEAQAYRSLIQDNRLTQEDVARKVGKDRASVANALRLLRLPPSIQDWVHEGKLSMGHARALLTLDSEKLQTDLARQVIGKGLSVRAVEEKARKLASPGIPKAVNHKQEEPNLAAALSRLRQQLGTKVEVSGGNRRGKILIYYYSEEDFNRLFDQLLGQE